MREKLYAIAFVLAVLVVVCRLVGAVLAALAACGR